MSENDSHRDERIIVAFSERFWADRAEGDPKPLSHYLDLYPEHEDLIAVEYVANVRESDSQATRVGEYAAASFKLTDDRLGPYSLETELGRGGQGIVYKAIDSRLGRPVALKILGELGPGAEGRLARFRREAEAASKLDHPGICGVHDAGIIAGVPYIAMRFVQGATLAQRIAISQNEAEGVHGSPTFVSFDEEAFEESGSEKDDAKLESAASSMTRSELADLLLIFEKTARALHAAHEAGVLHRDIKPGNIMVTEEREPIILDFGLAQIEGDDAGPTLTQTGDLFGTPAYMSPEQITGQRVKLDRRSDVYSLGVTLFECLTLKRPFDAPTREGLYNAVMTKEAPDPRRLNKVIPRDLKVVLETAIAKDRDRRYQSAEALAEELKAVRELRPIAAKPIGFIGRTTRWAKRRPALAALTAALIVGLPLLTGMAGYIFASLPQIEKQELAERDARVEEHLEQGFYETYHGDPEMAVNAFEEALVENEDCVEAIAGLAIAHARLRRPESALAVLDRSSSPHLLALRADMLRDLGRNDDAEKAAANAIEPDDALGWFIVGSQALREGESVVDEHAASREAAFRRARDNYLLAVQASPHARRVLLFGLAHATGRLEEKPDALLLAKVLQKRWPEDSWAWFWSAFALDGQAVHSVDAYREALRLNPHHANSHYNLGLALIRWGQDDEALGAFREAIRIAPDHAGARIALANALARNDDLPAAEAELREFIAIDPGHARAHWSLAQVLTAQGRGEEALGSFGEATKITPDNASLRREYAVALTFLSQLDEAADQYREMVRIEPLDPMSHYLLGVHELRRRHRPTEALLALNEARRLKADDAMTLWETGDALLQLDEKSKGIEAYAEATRVAPRDFWRREHLGNLLMQEGRLEEAKAQLREAARLQPEAQGVWGLIAQNSIRLKDWEAAIEAYRQNLRIEPRSNVRTALARLFFELGRSEDAVVQLREYLRHHPEDAAIHNQLAWALVNPDGDASLRDPKEARALAEKAATLTGRRDLAILDTLAVAHFASGDAGAAAKVQREILEIMDGKSMGGLNIEQAKAALERYQAALSDKGGR